MNRYNLYVDGEYIGYIKADDWKTSATARVTSVRFIAKKETVALIHVPVEKTIDIKKIAEKKKTKKSKK